MNTPASSPPQNETPTAEASPASKATLDGLDEHLTKAANTELENKVYRIVDNLRDTIRKELGIHEAHIAVTDLRIDGDLVGREGTRVTGTDICRAVYAVFTVGAKERYTTMYKERFMNRITELEKKLEETQAELQNLQGGGGQ